VRARGEKSPPEAVNNFLKKIFSQEMYSLSVAFANVRVNAGGVFGAARDCEKMPYNERVRE
jgi:hypothetical protein